MSSQGLGFFSADDSVTPEALKRRRAYVQALAEQGQSPGQGMYGGLASAGKSIAAALLGRDLDADEKNVAANRAKALGSILNPQPQIQDVASTGMITQPGELAGRQASGVYNTPIEKRPSMAEALAQSGNSELMQQFAPALLQNQLAQENFTREHDIQRQDVAQDFTRDRGAKLEDYSRARADKTVRFATPEDKTKAGIDPRTPATVDAFNNIKPITDPNQITAYQQAEIRQQQAQLGETKRHNTADEQAKLHPFGIGASADTGDEFLKALPPGIAGQVKAIASYRQAPPASRSAQSMALMNAVNQFNPTYDSTQFGAKSKARNDFTTGKSGNTVRSLNVAVQHLDQLGQLSQALGNGNVQLFNKLSQGYAAQTGSAAPSNFNAAKQLVGDEIVKAIVGAGGGVGDREEAAKNISSASSPQQLAGVIQTYKGLMAGQLSGLKQQYQKSTGLDDFEDYLAPETKSQLETHTNSSGGQRKVVKYGDLP